MRNSNSQFERACCARLFTSRPSNNDCARRLSSLTGNQGLPDQVSPDLRIPRQDSGGAIE
jgi:hypothetical protein